MFELTLSKINDGAYRVLLAGQHVGTLKRINALWKFKAIGYDHNGDLVPGGGPLTERHNTTFADLDEAVIGATLAPP